MQVDESRPPAYELFFAPLAVSKLIDPTGYERIQFAYFMSKYGHAKQVRKGGGRYFDHPKAAAWIYIDELKGRDSRIIIDILLHDISEDTYLLSPYRTSVNFGEEIALDVRAVTKLPNQKESTEEYLHRVIMQGPWSIVTKLCDRLHNIRTLSYCEIEEQKKKIAETKKVYIPMLFPALEKYEGDWKNYSEILKEKLFHDLSDFPF